MKDYYVEFFEGIDVKLGDKVAQIQCLGMEVIEPGMTWPAATHRLGPMTQQEAAKFVATYSSVKEQFPNRLLAELILETVRLDHPDVKLLRRQVPEDRIH